MDVLFEESQSTKYFKEKGWVYQTSGDQLVTDCPICGKPGHFYMGVGDKFVDGKNVGPCWDCKVCGRTGNLKSLRKELGDPIHGLVSMQDAQTPHEPRRPMPDIDEHHNALLAHQEALDYLVCERGYTMDVIERMKLGLWWGRAKDIPQECWWITYPYVNGGKYVYCKMRTLPPTEKAFHGATGRENPLYNQDVIHPDTGELFMVEGEADCLSMLSQGYASTLGVPGANMKKAVWVDKLDVWWASREGKTRRIYVLYDNDKVGQEAAAEITKRIGIDRVLLIRLPEFTKAGGTPGKDINEYFLAGHSREDFEALRTAAKPLQIKGVMDIMSALDVLDGILEKRGNLNPTFDTPWPPLNKLVGGEAGDVIGIMAEGKVGKTTFAMNWVDYFVGVKNIDSMILCFEMTQERLARKWASYVTKTPDSPTGSQFTRETIQLARTIITNRTADLVLGYCSAQKTEEVFDLIRQAVRRYGIKVLVLDNLHLMIRSIQHQTQEISVLTKRIKDLAIELGILVLLVIQPKRVEKDEIVAARHASGSAAIEKDVDAMICLHRNRDGIIKASEFQGAIEQDQNFLPYMLVRVDLSRYSPGGVITLYMDGATSTVRVMNPDEATQQTTVPSVGPEVPIEV